MIKETNKKYFTEYTRYKQKIKGIVENTQRCLISLLSSTLNLKHPMKSQNV